MNAAHICPGNNLSKRRIRRADSKNELFAVFPFARIALLSLAILLRFCAHFLYGARDKLQVAV